MNIFSYYQVFLGGKICWECGIVSIDIFLDVFCTKLLFVLTDFIVLYFCGFINLGLMRCMRECVFYHVWLNYYRSIFGETVWFWIFVVLCYVWNINFWSLSLVPIYDIFGSYYEHNHSYTYQLNFYFCFNMVYA